MEAAANELVVPIANKLIGYAEAFGKLAVHHTGRQLDRHRATLEYRKVSREVLDLLAVQNQLKIQVHSFLYSGMSALECDAIRLAEAERRIERNTLNDMVETSLVVPQVQQLFNDGFMKGRSRVELWSEVAPFDYVDQIVFAYSEGHISNATPMHRHTKAEQGLLGVGNRLFEKWPDLKQVSVGMALSASIHMDWVHIFEVAPWEQGLDAWRLSGNRLSRHSKLTELAKLQMHQLLERCANTGLAFGLSGEDISEIISDSETGIVSNDTVEAEFAQKCNSEDCSKIGNGDASTLHSTKLRLLALVARMLLTGMQLRGLRACHYARNFSLALEPQLKGVDISSELFLEADFMSKAWSKDVSTFLAHGKWAVEWGVYICEVQHNARTCVKMWTTSPESAHDFATRDTMKALQGLTGGGLPEMSTVINMLKRGTLYGVKQEERVSGSYTGAAPIMPKYAIERLHVALQFKYNTSINKDVRIKSGQDISIQGITLDPLLGLQGDDSGKLEHALSKGRSELLILGSSNYTLGRTRSETVVSDLLYTSARERLVAYLPGTPAGLNSGYHAQKLEQPLFADIDSYAVRRATTRMHAIVGCTNTDKWSRGPLYRVVKELANAGSLYSNDGYKQLINAASQHYTSIRVSHVQALASNITAGGNLGNMGNCYAGTVGREILHDLVCAGRASDKDSGAKYDNYFSSIYQSDKYSDMAPLTTLVPDEPVLLAGTVGGRVEGMSEGIGLKFGKHVPLQLSTWSAVENGYCGNTKTRAILHMITDNTRLCTAEVLQAFEMGTAADNSYIERINRSLRLLGETISFMGISV